MNDIFTYLAAIAAGCCLGGVMGSIGWSSIGWSAIRAMQAMHALKSARRG